jgi:pSer/pThr/pTyr-binding forkhead associated (FHA) protein
MLEDNQGRRAIALEAATYSIGRDPTNGIVVDSDGVSRQHAILLRVPGNDGYRYRIIDGNSAGKPSLNGVTVNGTKCSSYDLGDGDQIGLAGTVKAVYYHRPILDEVYEKYIQSAHYRSIKSETVDPRGTMMFE